MLSWLLLSRVYVGCNMSLVSCVCWLQHFMAPLIACVSRYSMCRFILTERTNSTGSVILTWHLLSRVYENMLIHTRYEHLSSCVYQHILCTVFIPVARTSSIYRLHKGLALLPGCSAIFLLFFFSYRENIFYIPSASGSGTPATIFILTVRIYSIKHIRSATYRRHKSLARSRWQHCFVLKPKGLKPKA